MKIFWVTIYSIDLDHWCNCVKAWNLKSRQDLHTVYLREFEKTPTLNMLSFAFYIFMVTYRKTIFCCIIYIQHIYNTVKTLTLSFSKVLVTAGTKTTVEGSHWDYGHFCKGPPQTLDHERTASLNRENREKKEN